MTDEELWDALDGLHAYDDGSVDSGIHDEVLRERCVVELHVRASSNPDGFRLWISRAIRRTYLDEDALARGYGIEDVSDFIDWLDDRMNFAL
jgi:hypothetical protein